MKWDAMHTIDDAGRTASLVLELPSGTAILHGEEVELPLREFRLLAELARRVGEPVSSEDLIRAIWPDEPWTPKENLYILATRLRRLIDGSAKFGSNIRNRRGFGYMLDLDPSEVVLLDSAAPPSEDVVIRLEHDEPEGHDGQASEVDQANARPRIRLKPVAMATLVSLVAIGLAWSAGFVLSSRLSSRSDLAIQREAGTDREASDSSQPRNRSPRAGDSTTGSKRKSERRGRRGQAVAAGPSVSDDTPSVSGQDTPSVSGQDSSQGASQGSRKTSKKDQPVSEPALPPAPTRYLYHLVNENTGDHFVTTDGNTASEYEAKGYEGGTIARVYTYQEEGTKAISTNAGTAYIFISSAPKTEPPSKVLRLWYSTNDSGDFFYTTSESEAKQEGWQGSVIGYVRTL